MLASADREVTEGLYVSPGARFTNINLPARGLLY